MDNARHGDRRLSDPVRSRLAVALVLTLALVGLVALPASAPGWPSAVTDANAAQPGKTPPAKGKPTPKPTARPTPRPTPRPTSPPSTTNPTATPKPAPRSTPKPAPARTATPKPAVGPAGVAPSAPPVTGGSEPSASTRALQGAGSEGASTGIAYAAAALAALGGGFLAFAIARRRRRSGDAVAADAPNVVPFLLTDASSHADLLADPLLEAMASTARASGRGGRSGVAAGGGAPVTPAWVQRLDADVAGLADRQHAPAPPPHRHDHRRRRHVVADGDLEAAGGSGA